MSLTTKDNLFKPGKMSAADKAAQTTLAAQAIIDAETAERERKTARLRALRLEKEAVQPAQKERAPSRKGRKTVRAG